MTILRGSPGGVDDPQRIAEGRAFGIREPRKRAQISPLVRSRRGDTDGMDICRMGGRVQVTLDKAEAQKLLEIVALQTSELFGERAVLVLGAIIEKLPDDPGPGTGPNWDAFERMGG